MREAFSLSRLSVWVNAKNNCIGVFARTGTICPKTTAQECKTFTSSIKNLLPKLGKSLCVPYTTVTLSNACLTLQLDSHST